jgi:hypothetical protein
MSSPKKPAASRRDPGDVNVFRVESADPYGWIVYQDGFAKTHFFTGRSLALSYAREWAKVNAPSRLLVLGPDGRLDLDQIFTATVLERA